MFLSDSEAATLRAFRRVAQEARDAQPAAGGGEHRLRVVDGYLETEGWIGRIRPLCVPVRRATLEHDSVHIGRVAAILLRARTDPDLAALTAAVRDRYEAVLEELNSVSILGGSRVRHGDHLRQWLDAVVFHDSTQNRPSEKSSRPGTGAQEGIAMALALEVAALILMMDDLAADCLEEPRGGVTPPPPPAAPRRASRWRQLLQVLMPSPRRGAK